MMGASKITISFLGFAVMAVLLEISVLVSAKTQDCTETLIPCASYMSSASPPASCCNPLKQAVATQLECLCNVYTTPGLLQSLGVDLTQALNLGRACGVPVDISQCKSAAPSSQALPPAGETRKDNNGGGKIRWTGAFTLLLIWTLIVVYNLE